MVRVAKLRGFSDMVRPIGRVKAQLSHIATQPNYLAVLPG
jgi:hypothetical protein